jgi:hypothetical protein
MERQLTLFKVRDLRQLDQFKIDDVYLDKGYARACGKDASLVYMSLCRHAEFNSQQAFPSQEKIAWEHGIKTVRPVRKGLKKLVEYNLVFVSMERRDGKFSNYNYTLLDKSEWNPLPTIGKKVPTANHRSFTVGGETTSGEIPTKDNKVIRITKYKDNKDSGEPTPAEQMNKFLEDETCFNRVVDSISGKYGMPRENVLKEVKAFKNYWSEKNRSGTKQRWEMEKTFELSRRLSTWFRNAQKFNKTGKQKEFII